MRKPVRALCIILLFVLGTRASDEPQGTFTHDSEDLLNSVLNESIEYPPGVLDAQIENLLDFVSENQLVSTWTESMEMEDYMSSLSDSAGVYDYDTDQPMEYTELRPCTEQTNPLSSFYSTFHGSGTECLLACCIPNEPVQEYTVSESMSNYHRPTGTKRPEQTIEKNMMNSRKKQKNRKKSTASSLDTDSTEDDVLDRSEIKKYISVWNNARLKNRHRETLHVGYRLIFVFNKFKSNKYKEIGDKKHQSQIETHFKHCKAVYNTTPAQNKLWFAIVSRSTSIHTKLADCQAMNANPSDYKFMEELSGYYPGLPGDVVRYMDKYGPIVSKQESIKTEWNETLGDIYVRTPIEPEYGIDKETIIVEACNEYRLMDTAVQMILGLHEVHKDLSNLFVEFIEKALKEETDSNHLAVVKTLHAIVSKHKNSNKLEIDKQCTVLCNLFTDILHQTDVSPESIVIQLYAEMYKSFSYFYEKAEVCEKILDIEKKRRTDGKDKEYYLLAGKCIIKQQRYLKCATTIDLNKKDMGEYTHQITEETDKWSISSEVQQHYHIHYVDNTKQKYTRVCMPMCLDPIHTIGQTVKYLKKIYSIEKEECICPYKRNNSGDWKYIQEEERDKTVQEFAECDIVFYYIEEGLRENYFTFAEFESYKKLEKRAIRIPLFLSPLMQSAVSMGPFEEKYKEEHKLVDSMQFTYIQSNTYAYIEKYKAIEYSYMHHYYSNLYIRRDNADAPTIDCYIMDSNTFIRNGTITVKWYAKIPSSVDEYMHCILSDELINDQGEYDKFSKAIKSREYTPDSALYGFSLQNSLETTSGLDGVGFSTDDPIDPNSITDCKLSIVPIHKTSTNPKIANLQSEIDKLDSNIKQINIEINNPKITEEQKKKLKKKRNFIYTIKSKCKQKLKKIQIEDQSFVEEEFSAIPLPLCSFLVFHSSNTQTKSSLGTHNEILDAMFRRYNNTNNR